MISQLDLYRSLIQDTVQYLRQDPLLYSCIYMAEEKTYCSPPPHKTPQKVAALPFVEQIKQEPLPAEKISFKPPEPAIPPPMKTPPSRSFEGIEKQVQTLFPSFTLLKDTPEDHISYYKDARKKERLLQADTLLLDFQESPQETLFLENVRQAITLYFGPAMRVPVKDWDSKWAMVFEDLQAKLIVAPPSLKKHAPLLPWYRENPSSMEFFLGSCRLLITQPLSSYFHHPLHKKVLWQSLCKLLKTPSTLPSFSTTP